MKMQAVETSLMQELGQTAKYDDKTLFKTKPKKEKNANGDTFKTKTKVITNNIQVKSEQHS